MCNALIPVLDALIPFCHFCKVESKFAYLPFLVLFARTCAFRRLQPRWDIRFLGDYLDRGVLEGVNPNFYGMIESIVCSRADVFVGTWWSTFTGYIHRLRGYHGLGEQTYYHTHNRLNNARSANSVGHGFSREWRFGWTDDRGGLISERNS